MHAAEISQQTIFQEIPARRRATAALGMSNPGRIARQHQSVRGHQVNWVAYIFEFVSVNRTRRGRAHPSRHTSLMAYKPNIRLWDYRLTMAANLVVKSG